MGMGRDSKALEEQSRREEAKGHPRCVFIVAMGVSGTGKSTLGSAIANALHMPYVEGDELHTKSNVDKMSKGQPLTDEDREPWLELIRKTAEQYAAESQYADGDKEGKCHGVVITCSSLKRYYRDILRGRLKPASNDPNKPTSEQRLPPHHEPPQPDELPTYFVFIKGGRDIIWERMQQRKDHYMKANMLDSQLATLESPEGEEGVVTVGLEESTEEQVEKAKEGIARMAGDWFRDAFIGSK